MGCGLSVEAEFVGQTLQGGDLGWRWALSPVEDKRGGGRTGQRGRLRPHRRSDPVLADPTRGAGARALCYGSFALGTDAPSPEHLAQREAAAAQKLG